jgi:DNA-nicking Smr family endonuclease
VTGDSADGRPPIELPITGELDLHTFHPRDVKRLVVDYLEEARRRGLTSVRIVHGKGTGTLRATVRAVLARRPDLVLGVSNGGSLGGSWGATVVHLAPANEAQDEDRPSEGPGHGHA